MTDTPKPLTNDHDDFTRSYVWETLYMKDGSVIERVPPPNYPVPMVVENHA